MAQDPYQTPPSAPASAIVQGPYGSFRSNRILAMSLITGIILDGLLNVFFTLLHISGKRIGFGPDAALSASDKGLLSLGYCQIGIVITCVTLFFVWVNRSCKNAWLLDAPRINVTPGWAVGYFFIPFFNLWKPYVAMKQIRSASYSSDHRLTKILPLWWLSWLGLCLVVFIIVMVTENSTTPQGTEIAEKLGIIRTPVKLAFYIAAIFLIHHITRAQHTHIRKW